MTMQKSLDLKKWIPLSEANDRHQAANGSSGDARDLAGAIKTGALEFGVFDAARGDHWTIPFWQLAPLPDRLLIAPTVTTAFPPPLSDFVGCTVITDRAQFELWSATHRGVRKTRTRPQLDDTKKVLSELFPNGPPPGMTDDVLLSKIIREFTKRKWQNFPSKETVRRAAGRRKVG